MSFASFIPEHTHLCLFQYITYFRAFLIVTVVPYTLLLFFFLIFLLLLLILFPPTASPFSFFFTCSSFYLFFLLHISLHLLTSHALTSALDSCLSVVGAYLLFPSLRVHGHTFRIVSHAHQSYTHTAASAPCLIQFTPFLYT